MPFVCPPLNLHLPPKKDKSPANFLPHQAHAGATHRTKTTLTMTNDDDGDGDGGR